MLMYTLGKICRDDLDWVVEEHDGGEILLTCESVTAARLRLSSSRLLGPIEPEPEWADPPERMDLLRQDVVAVLASEGRQRRGPWADLEGSSW